MHKVTRFPKMPDLPVRVCRVGGKVMTFDQPHKAYKRVGRPSVIAELEVPAGARVVYPRSTNSWNNTKLRAEWVRVLDLDGAEALPALNRPEFEYRVGEIVEPDAFDPDTTKVSTHGIHCFPTRICATHYGND